MEEVASSSLPLSRSVDTYKNIIRQYGIISPPVIGDFEDGTKALLYGDAELKAMSELQADYAEAILVSLGNKVEGDKLSLMLMDIKSTPDAIEQGKLINNLVDSGQYTQTDVAGLLNRSLSWVNKRLNLITRLIPEVREMVSKRLLSPQSAQEIARMPLEVQQAFSSKIVDGKIPKSTVERLVAEYGKENCRDNFKSLILGDPAKAIEMLPNKSEKKVERQKKESGTETLLHINEQTDLGDVIALFNKVLNVLTERTFFAEPETLLKYEKSLKNLLTEIDAISKIIVKRLYKVRFPFGKCAEQSLVFSKEIVSGETISRESVGGKLSLGKTKALSKGEDIVC
jgi:ParB family chromosome partitioning protein